MSNNFHPEAIHTKIDMFLKNFPVGGQLEEDIFLSIVIPAFNERDRLPDTIMQTLEWCSRSVPSFELLIVDDGSSDDTKDIARSFSLGIDRVITLARPHLGKGAAVREGMMSASGRYVLFMDADGSTPLDEMHKLFEKMDEGYPIAIGSRVVMNPKETVVVTSFHRRFLGRIFAIVVNVLAVPKIRDTQCGFKMFRRDAARALFSRQKCNGFSFDVEILHLADKYSFPVAEVPVNWFNRKGSKVSVLSDGFRMLKDILWIRFVHRNR